MSEPSQPERSAPDAAAGDDASQPRTRRGGSGRRPWRRWLVRGAFVGLGLLVFAIAVVLIDGWRAFGKLAQGERLARMQASAQWDGDGFENPEPLWNDMWGGMSEVIFGDAVTAPEAPIPFERVPPERFDTPPPTGLRVTWFGHSSMLVEIDGVRLLTDPVWGPRASPLTWLGPVRWYPPLIALEDLPRIDAVLVSHDHYDHLDYPTITAIKDWDTKFIVPLGVGAHLEYWGVPVSRIVEVDWWDRVQVGGIEIASTPARHASGRQLYDQNATLWGGYAMLGPDHRVYFSGDTGLFSELERIGAELGPFDLTMIEDGAYGQGWPDWHIGPEQAVLAHRIVGGKVMFGVHWGLFDLAAHGWTEPIERTLVAAAATGVEVVVPRPGQSFEPQQGLPLQRWWPDVPWRSAQDHPIVSTKVDALRQAHAP